MVVANNEKYTVAHMILVLFLVMVVAILILVLALILMRVVVWELRSERVE